MCLQNKFGVTSEFYQTSKKETIIILHKFFLKIEEEHFSTFYEASFIPTLKPDKNIVRKENCKPVAFIM